MTNAWNSMFPTPVKLAYYLLMICTKVPNLQLHQHFETKTASISSTCFLYMDMRVLEESWVRWGTLSMDQKPIVTNVDLKNKYMGQVLG